MAPDRGSTAVGDTAEYGSISTEDETIETAEEPDISVDEDSTVVDETEVRDEARRFLAEHADEPQDFTVRSVLLGLAIGVIICFSNMYFGLQTGWVSGMAMPAALIGFAFFKTVAKHINYPFTPVENVLVQTVAGALGTMPLGCGFVGVLPALNYLLKPDENGPLILGTGKLMIWAIGICFFGVFIAVPLRKEVLIRQKLKFPSGTATALMIGVLHGNTEEGKKQENPMETFSRRSQDMSRPTRSTETQAESAAGDSVESQREVDHRGDWKANMRLLIIAFGISGVYTLASYFIPPLHDIPILGLPLAHDWLWTFNPSPAYIGQGIIMGPATTLHMFLGAVAGWGILSPLAKNNGWAPGSVEDWETGSKGWIVWVSLAIMLADSIVNLGWLVLRPTLYYAPHYIQKLKSSFKDGSYRSFFSPASSKGTYTPLATLLSNSSDPAPKNPDPLPELDAPPEQLVSNRIVYLGLLASVVLCVGATHIVFASLIPLYATLLAVVLALVLSLMGVRALGETDLNPVSGISKLTQLAFALIIPPSNPNAIIINLLAGAISESGALQAGDMMQDLKTGYLLGAAPKAQFYGQLIGSLVGAIVSAAVYQLYTSVYPIPGGMFQAPTAYVWIFTARLVTGKGLPLMALQWALGAGCIFAVTTAVRIKGQGTQWQAYIPGGIAVAVGMYNVPSFTLARTCGGLVSWWWGRRGGEEGTVIVLASGLILGEGVVSIVNLGLASLKAPHL